MLFRLLLKLCKLLNNVHFNNERKVLVMSCCVHEVILMVSSSRTILWSLKLSKRKRGRGECYSWYEQQRKTLAQLHKQQQRYAEPFCMISKGLNFALNRSVLALSSSTATAQAFQSARSGCPTSFASTSRPKLSGWRSP